MDFNWHKNVVKTGLRIIKTARTVDTINQAAREGFSPIVKKVEPSAEIRSKFAVMQNKSTKEINMIGDFRAKNSTLFGPKDSCEMIIDWTFYYPHKFESPIAAYLVPEDIEVGERVMLEDLIEDYIGSRWNQGDTFRLKSCEAIWNGEAFEIQYDPEQNCQSFMG